MTLTETDQPASLLLVPAGHSLYNAAGKCVYTNSTGGPVWMGQWTKPMIESVFPE